MKILGIDQSLTCTGMVLFDKGEAVHFELITTAADKTDEFDRFKRAEYISDRIVELCDEENITDVSIEGLGFGSSGNATRDLGGLQYLIVTKLMKNNTNIIITPPTTLKKYATDNGRASKVEVFEAIEARDKSAFLEIEKVKKTKGRYDLADAYWLGRYMEDHS